MNKAATRMKEIEATLSGVAARWQRKHGGALPPGARVQEQIERRTPFDELAEKEARAGLREPATMPLFDDLPERKTAFDDLTEQELKMRDEGENVMGIWLEANAWLLDFLFYEGPHPMKVMRRLYCWVKKFRPEAIWDMGYRQLGVLLDESDGTMEARMGLLLDDYARAKGLTGVKAPWQRTAEACASYSDAQLGNSNRLGGKRASKSKLKPKK